MTKTAPLYRPGACIYEAYPQVLLGLNGISTLRQRVGDRFGGTSVDQAADTGIGDQSHTGVSGALSATNGMWLRVGRMQNRMKAKESTTGTDYDDDASTMEIGFDGALAAGDGGILVGAVLLHDVSGNAETSWRAGLCGYDGGHNAREGYGVGSTLTWYGDKGFYVDAAAQLTWCHSALTASPAGALAGSNNALGHAISMESGKRVAINDDWSVTPQAQLSYSKGRFSKFSDVFDALVSPGRDDSPRGRFGLALDYQAKTTRLCGIVNVYHEFLDGRSVTVNDVTLGSSNNRVRAGVGAGGSCSWANGRYSLCGEAIYNSSTGGDGSRGYGSTISLRVTW